jgi:hypothetical protein
MSRILIQSFSNGLNLSIEALQHYYSLLPMFGFQLFGSGLLGKNFWIHCLFVTILLRWCFDLGLLRDNSYFEMAERRALFMEKVNKPSNLDSL